MIKKFLNRLKSFSRVERFNVFNASGKVVERDIPRLITLLSDKSVVVRYQAAWALWQHDNKEAYDALTLALKDKDVRVRYYAALGIGKIGGENAFELLLDTLQHDEGYVQRSAADGLGVLGEKRAIEPLLECLDKGIVPYECATALAKFKETRAIKSIIRALKRYEGCGWGALFGSLHSFDELGRQAVLDATKSEEKDLREGSFIA
jgi:HEAT repeats